MSLDGQFSSDVQLISADSLSDEVSHVSEIAEVSVTVEKGEKGPHHAFLPTLLRNCAEGIRGATRTALDNGRSVITAKTSRERLIAALSSIPGVKLVEV